MSATVYCFGSLKTKVSSGDKEDGALTVLHAKREMAGKDVVLVGHYAREELIPPQKDQGPIAVLVVRTDPGLCGPPVWVRRRSSDWPGRTFVTIWKAAIDETAVGCEFALLYDFANVYKQRSARVI